MIALLITACTALYPCTARIENITTISKADDVKKLFDFNCKSVVLDNIKPLREAGDSAYPTFLSIDNMGAPDETMTLTISNSDFSQFHVFLEQTGRQCDVDITITNSDIGTAFRRRQNQPEIVLHVSKVTVMDSTINTTRISMENNVLTANNISFVNCTFVGKPMLDSVTDEQGMEVLRLCNYKNQLCFKPDECVLTKYSLEFVDCVFDFDDDNATQKDSSDGMFEKFLISISDTDIVEADISFVRCYMGENAQQNEDAESADSLKLLKIVSKEEYDESPDMQRRISVRGVDCGFNIEWSWVDDKSKLYKSSNWTTVVNSTGYYPTPVQQPTNDNGDDNAEGGAKDSKTVKAVWQTVAIAFIVICALVIVALIVVVILLAKRGRFDRSEGEN